MKIKSAGRVGLLFIVSSLFMVSASVVAITALQLPATGSSPAGVSLVHPSIGTQHRDRPSRSHLGATYAKSERAIFPDHRPVIPATVSCALSQVMRVYPAAWLPPEPGCGG